MSHSVAVRMSLLGPIDLPPITYPDNQDAQRLILNQRNDPVVTHPVFPKLTQTRALERLAKGTRVFHRRQPLPQKADDAPCNGRI